MIDTAASSPTYDLQKAKELVAEGKASLAQRAYRWLNNHYNDHPRYIVQDVFERIEASGFYKSMELEKRPGTIADVYRSKYDDMEWYTKFFINSEGGEEQLVVEIWSCRWDTTMN